jgi:replicative DNA helicase
MGQSLLVPWKTKAEITRESIERYEGLNKGATAKAVPTGFPIMDNYLGGGFRGGKLVIIAARPGVGKTTLANNMMKNMCRAGYCCGYFSLEMDSAENDDRWIAADSNVNTMKLYSEPGPSQEEWKRIIETAQRQSDWHLLIDDTGGLKIGEIKRRARQMVKAGAEIIFIDQLSKIGGKRNLSTFERNSEHVEELAFLKKELRIPIVLLAQLNRDLEKRQHKKPMLADLKNTGQLEEDADIALLGYRPGLYEQELPVDPEPAEWEIAKNRQGATRNIEMMFRRSRVKFYEVEKNGGK